MERCRRREDVAPADILAEDAPSVARDLAIINAPRSCERSAWLCAEICHRCIRRHGNHGRRRAAGQKPQQRKDGQVRDEDAGERSDGKQRETRRHHSQFADAISQRHKTAGRARQRMPKSRWLRSGNRVKVSGDHMKQRVDHTRIGLDHERRHAEHQERRTARWGVGSSNASKQPGTARHERRDKHDRHDERRLAAVDSAVGPSGNSDSTAPRASAVRTRMKVIIGAAPARISPKSPSYPENPLRQ